MGGLLHIPMRHMSDLGLWPGCMSTGSEMKSSLHSILLRIPRAYKLSLSASAALFTVINCLFEQ